MGATTFSTVAKGKTARDAFKAATTQARYEHGHGGYSGTIAEKHDFVMITMPSSVDPKDARIYADRLLDSGDRRIDDKWGPAGCIALGDQRWLFFGWASQ